MIHFFNQGTTPDSHPGSGSTMGATFLRHVVVVLALLFVQLLVATETFGELLPQNVGVIAVQGSEESLAIARHYVSARNIPPRNVFLLEKKYPSTISRKVWNEEIRPQIRAWLATRPDVRCVVCSWSVPLRIGGYDSQSPQVAGRLAFLDEKLRETRIRARALLGEINKLGVPATSEPELTNLSPDFSAKDFVAALQDVLRSAQGRISHIQDETLKKAEATKLAKAVLLAGGTARAAQAFANTSKERGVLLLAQRESVFALSICQSLPESNARDVRLLRLITSFGGFAEALRFLENEVPATRKNESMGSFDSELSLIFEEDWPLISWIANPISFYSKSAENMNRLVQRDQFILMVARLEAPSPEVVIRMIDDSIATEEKGLSGAIYLDARTGRPGGTPKHGSYEKMEQSLNDLGARLKTCTDLEVHLDTSGALFKKEACSSPAALYCGWYALESYRPTFTFVPGAIAYHVASLEAANLKGGKGWCPNLLKDGAAATCGPTFEPYVVAFPEPDEFFSLILTGKLTMIECYYRTLPTLSWAMTYVGDPLYTPYKNNPQLKEESLPQTLKSGSPQNAPQ
ncbi:MAG: TIGR03790 family protein [Planctomycetia bacterium]|nr:TIGR03790 family protein [Planctomycetia bacterium]